METVPWRRQQTEETFSTENSHCDNTSGAQLPPSTHTQSPQEIQTKSRRGKYHLNASLIGTNVYRWGVHVRRDRRNTEGFTLLTLRRPINANQAADSVRPIIAGLRTPTSAGGSEWILAQIKKNCADRDVFVSSCQNVRAAVPRVATEWQDGPAAARPRRKKSMDGWTTLPNGWTNNPNITEP